MSTDLEGDLRAALRHSTQQVCASTTFVEGVLAEARAAAGPTAPAARPRRGRTRLVGVALGVAALGVPASGAVATGPVSYRDAYGWMFAGPADGGLIDGPVDPGTLRRLASGPGLDGGVFSVVSGSNAAGRTCLTVQFETAESAARPLPTDLLGLGGSGCRTAPSALPFGRDASLGLAELGRSAVFHMAAGEAVRAELRADATGKTYPVLFAHGNLFGWMPTIAADLVGVEEAYTVIGYAADGRVVGQGRVLGLTPYDAQGRIVGPREDENGRIITDGRTLTDPGR